MLIEGTPCACLIDNTAYEFCLSRWVSKKEFTVHLDVRTIDGRAGEGFPEGALLNASRCGERRTVHTIRQFL